jgi:hypothetical protein
MEAPPIHSPHYGEQKLSRERLERLSDGRVSTGNSAGGYFDEIGDNDSARYDHRIRDHALTGEAGGDRDCDDFGSQAAAQSFFLKHGGPDRDPHRLDDDPGRDDGLACEVNRQPYRGLLSIKYKSGDFKGKLKAVTGSCERGRTIRVYKKRSGPDRLIGEDITDDRGRCKVDKSGANGKFYSKSTDRGNCENDRSFRTIRV